MSTPELQIFRRLALCLAASSLWACAAPRVVTVSEPTGEPATAAASVPRRERMKQILRHNVRVLLYDGKEGKKTASGVVVGTEMTGGGAISYVMTNAHAIDPAGMTAPSLRVVLERPWEGGAADPVELPAEAVAVGEVPSMDLALLRVRGIRLEPAELASPHELIPGDAVVVAAAPFGRAISLSGGLISAIEWDRTSGLAQNLKTDAAIGYGASGGGVYSVETGRLVAIVEGYRTARVGFAVQQEQFSFEVPMPGETFAAPSTKVRAFLEQKGFAAP